jgi:hypothetical protein
VCQTPCIYTVKRNSSFSLSTFLRGSSRKSTQHPIFSCLKEPNKIKNEVWFYRFSKESARLSSIITVFFQASKLMPACSPCWSFLSLDGGFKFRSCAIAVSNRYKTSRQASKDHYLAFPSEKRHCCVEFRNVR